MLTLTPPQSRAGKRDSDTTEEFLYDQREREISTDGCHPYRNAIRDAFDNRATHGGPLRPTA
jgi:hypothetical protein